MASRRRPPIVVPPRRRVGPGWWIAAAALALATAGVWLARSPGRSAEGPPLHGARWIWAPGLERADQPVAFYALRDFEIDVPAPGARLLIQADEEYIVLLNGSVVGANRYRPGAPLDLYRVGGELRPGRNRLLVELRSSRGVGGLLCALELPDGRVVTSGDDWLVRWWYDPAIADPAAEPPPETVSPARSWARRPTGRWGAPAEAVLRPGFSALRVGRRSVPPVRLRVGRDGAWEAVAGGRHEVEMGKWVTLDFGEEVTGYPTLRFAGTVRARGLLYFGAEPPDPAEARPGAFVIGMPGLSGWTDSVPRRLRYLTVVGNAPVVFAGVLRVDPERAADLLADEGDSAGAGSGVFGVSPPELETPMEDEVWRELEGIPRRGGRKGG